MTEPTNPPVEEPYQRTSGPVHTWFGLSYSTYQVLPRVLMQSMPLEWQRRMVGCLEEMRAAFAHVEQPEEYRVQATTGGKFTRSPLPGYRHGYVAPDEDAVRPSPLAALLTEVLDSHHRGYIRLSRGLAERIEAATKEGA